MRKNNLLEITYGHKNSDTLNDVKKHKKPIKIILLSTNPFKMIFIIKPKFPQKTTNALSLCLRHQNPRISQKSVHGYSF